MLSKKEKIFIAGHDGMVGASVYNLLKKKKFTNILVVKKKKLNLLNQKKTFNFLIKEKPRIVIIAAAKVGGIKINNLRRANFIYENLQIQNNLIHGSYLAGVKKLIFLGSSCIYPKNCKQPIKEEYLLGGPLEYTNEPYAIAKIAGLKMCESYNKQFQTDFISLMPCNLYGPNDNFNLENSHFLPALLKKVYEAKIKKKKTITIWGNGKSLRELMHVDDLAEACYFFLKKKTNHSLINIGSGEEYTVMQYVQKIMKFLNVKLKIKKDTSMPDGTKRKILNCSIAKKYGWKPKIKFSDGLENYYKSFLKLVTDEPK